MEEESINNKVRKNIYFEGYASTEGTDTYNESREKIIIKEDIERHMQFIFLKEDAKRERG